MRLLTSCVLAVSLAGSAAAEELVAGGKRTPGTLQSVEAGVLTFAPADGSPVQRLAVKDVTAIVYRPAAPPPAKFDEIELVDGSVLRCESVRIKGKTVDPGFAGVGPGDTTRPKVELPLESVFGVLRSAHDGKNREKWKKLLADRGKRDLLVIAGEEQFTSVAGTVLDGTDVGDAIQFEREADGQRVTYKLTRATGGLLFNPPPRTAIPPTLCRVTDRYGNTLAAQELKVTGSAVTVRTVAGAAFEYPAGGLAKLDFGQANVAYLSDLEPKVDAPPAVPGEPAFTFLRDRTSENGPLRLDGVSYTKGLWVAPDVTLAFPLGGEYRELRAVVGVDETVGVANSAVRLVIEADGRVLFNELVSRKDKPRPLALDVKGAKQVTVRVEPQGLYLGNQVNLAEARVQK